MAAPCHVRQRFGRGGFDNLHSYGGLAEERRSALSEGALGALGQLLLVAPSEQEGGRDRDDEQDEQSDRHRPLDPLDPVTEFIGGAREEARPAQTAERVPQRETRPGHAIGSRQDGGEDPQQRDEASEEDDLP